MHAAFSVLGFGLDSLLASLVAGAFLRSWRERLALAAAFGAFDSAATLAGPLWSSGVSGPSALATYLVAALLLAVAARYNRTLFYWLPVILSFDNLFGGFPASAPVLGAASTLMSLLGFSLAALLRRELRASQAEG